MARQLNSSAALLGTVLAFVIMTSDSRPNFARQLTFRSEVDLVRMAVTALDTGGRPVFGLTADDFDVYEDGHIRPVSIFEEVCADYRPAALPLKVPGRRLGQFLGGT